MIKKCPQFFFSNLNVPQYKGPLVNLENINDPLKKVREKYKSRPSILAIWKLIFFQNFSKGRN